MKTKKDNHSSSILTLKKQDIAKIDLEEHLCQGIYHSSEQYAFQKVHKGKKSLSELGYKIYFLTEKSLFSDKKNFQYSLSMIKEMDAYLFDKDKNKLYYSSSGYLETVILHDTSLFIEKLNQILEQDVTYSYYFFTFKQIDDLITQNSGHKPSKLTDNLSTYPTARRRSQLLNDLFPAKEGHAQPDLDDLFIKKQS